MSITFKELSSGRDVRHSFSILSRHPRLSLFWTFLKTLVHIRP